MQADEPTVPPVCDVHAHYLPRGALPLMGAGRAVVTLADVRGVPDNVTLNGMAVGATAEQLSAVEAMLDTMNATGIDMRVLSPPPFTYRYWADPSDGLRLCQLLNDATAAVVSDHPAQFRGLCTLPLQDPGLAMTELDRSIDTLGLAGVTLGTNVAGCNLSDPALRPLLSAIAERELPVLVHPDFVPNDRLAQHYLLNLVGMPTETATALANLILSGTLAELPRLRICFVHGGGSFPYLLGRLRKGWRVRPETREHTPEPPDRYLGTIYFDTLTHSAQALRYLVDLVGVEHVVIGTDSPFDVEDPAPLEHLGSCEGLTSQDRETISRVTPSRWLLGPDSDAREGA